MWNQAEYLSKQIADSRKIIAASRKLLAKSERWVRHLHLPPRAKPEPPTRKV